AGFCTVALAKMIGCASVVLPQPGVPAMMLKENSGTPPPRISSRPRTPVGSFRIETLAGLPAAFLGALRLAALFCFFIFLLAGNQVIPERLRPHVFHQTQRQRLANE